jgi:glutaredoxin-like protein NrdH
MQVINHIEGTDKGELLIYTLSTCTWCKQTRAFEVDVLPDEEKDKTLTEMKHFNPQCSFPTLVVNGKKCVVGYDETKIKKILGI